MTKSQNIKSYRTKKGNVAKRDRFMMIEHWEIRSAAWRELTPRDIRVYLLLHERYNGHNNGRISLSIREAAKFGRMAKSSAQKALRRLEELGFIKLSFKGSFSQKIRDGSGNCYASEYTLTSKKVGDSSPTKDFMSWIPKKKTVPKQNRHDTKIGPIWNDDVI